MAGHPRSRGVLSPGSKVKEVYYCEHSSAGSALFNHISTRKAGVHKYEDASEKVAWEPSSGIALIYPLHFHRFFYAVN